MAVRVRAGGREGVRERVRKGVKVREGGESTVFLCITCC